MKTSFSLQDQETIIVVQPKQVADVADVYTNIPSMINKLKKLARERPDAVVITRDEGDAIFASRVVCAPHEIRVERPSGTGRIRPVAPVVSWYLAVSCHCSGLVRGI